MREPKSLPSSFAVRALLLATITTLSSLGVVRADAPTTAPATQPTTQPAADARPAVARLVSAAPADRDTIQRELLDAPIDGQALLSALRAARNDRSHAHDLDLNSRLDAMLVQAQERFDLGPTYVSINVKDAPITEVLRTLHEQGKADFTDPNADFGGAEQVPKVTLNLDHVTFWAALREMQSAAHVSIYPQGGENGWRVLRSNSGMAGMNGTESGAFLIQAAGASYSRNISYQTGNGGGGSTNENFSFQFNVFAEPKIHIEAGSQGVLTIDRAVDSNGNDLIGAQRIAGVSVGGQGSGTMNCNVQLSYPKHNPGDHFQELSGTIRVLTARRTQMVTSDDFLAEPVPLHLQTTDGVSLTLQADRRGPTDPNAPPVQQGEAANAAPHDGPPVVTSAIDANGTLAVVAVVDGGDAQANERIASTLQQIRVTDEAGTRMTLSGFGQNRPSPSRVEIRLTFTRNGAQPQPQPQLQPAEKDASDGQPAAPKLPKIKVQLDVPTSIRPIEIPFSLKGMKMP